MMETITDDEPLVIYIDASMDLLPPRPTLPGASCFSMCCKAPSHDYKDEDEATMATELLSPMSLAETPKGGESLARSLILRSVSIYVISNPLLAIPFSFRYSHCGWWNRHSQLEFVFVRWGKRSFVDSSVGNPQNCTRRHEYDPSALSTLVFHGDHGDGFWKGETNQEQILRCGAFFMSTHSSPWCT
jgi:hypothetical protein